MMSDTVTAKHAKLCERLRNLKRVVVAFSGGIDSTLLLRVAVDTLGSDNVLAITGRSPSVPSAELNSVAELAREVGAQHRFVDTQEFNDPQYLSNPTNRCYFCKDELYSHLEEIARQIDFGVVLSGANADDLGDYRPGLEAAREHEVVSPMAEVGLAKVEIREIAAELGLSIHDKPAAPCLSSRVQYGEQITPEKLACIDAAETFLREQGFRECRVRHHHNLARIEVPPHEVIRLADPALRDTIDAKFRELGYQYVTLDLRGFRSGSMNEVLLGGGLRGINAS
jgi:uncharacterized protein